LVTDSERKLNGHSEKVIGVILGPLEQKIFNIKDKDDEKKLLSYA